MDKNISKKDEIINELKELVKDDVISTSFVKQMTKTLNTIEEKKKEFSEKVTKNKLVDDMKEESFGITLSCERILGSIVYELDTGYLTPENYCEYRGMLVKEERQYSKREMLTTLARIMILTTLFDEKTTLEFLEIMKSEQKNMLEQIKEK